MKIAISSTGKEIDSQVDSVFGRCSYFIIADIEDKKLIGYKAIENIFSKRQGNAGISTAQFVIEKGINSVISSNFGPKASEVFKQFNIRLYRAEGSIRSAINDLIENKLKTLG